MTSNKIKFEFHPRLCNILRFFTAVKMIIFRCDIFFLFAVNIDRGYSFEPPLLAVLTSTHDLCLKQNKKKI